MNLRASSYRIVSNIYFKLKGFKSPQVWQFLNKSQWWSREKIQDFQNRELHKLIEYVYEYVPYYRKIMREKGLKPKDIQITDDLIRFPVLSKENFRKNWKELISTKIKSFKTSIRKTGGSTGEPLQIINDYSNGAWEGAAFRRGLGFTGYKLGDAMITLFGGTLGLAPEKKIDKLKARFSGTVFLPAFEISHKNLSKYVKKIEKSKAKFLRGYTSAIYLLAKLIDEAKLSIPLQAVYPTAETLFDFQRKQIEKTFQCKIFNQYGCGELNSIAFECPSHNGLHVADEHVMIESLKKERRATEGEMGALTLTALHNFAMPLIRYQNGDIVALSNKPCPCGRGLSRIIKLYGRTNDLLLARDGRLISSIFIPHLFRETEGIRQIQLIQETEDLIQLKVVKGSKFSKEELEIRLNTIRKYLGDIKIDIEFVDSMPQTPQGKLKFVISKFGDNLLCN